jgi:phthiocerol/phenolphthiocerol synthesis type-I polyketide synthase E
MSVHATTEPVPTERAEGHPTPQLLLLSAESECELDRATSEVCETLAGGGGDRLEELARELRSRHAGTHRRMLVCSSPGEALAVLRTRDAKRLLSERSAATPRPVVFLLPGVGDQYVGMAHELYLHWSVFRHELDRCAQLFQEPLDHDIRTLLYPPSHAWKRTEGPRGYDLKSMLGRGTDAPEDADSAALNRTLFAQAALFTIEYATVRLWQSLGVEPQAMICHSLGEYVAACIAGVMSLADAVSLVAARAKLVDALPQATMLCVLLSEQELQPLLPDDVVVSLINGPKLCVVAGPLASIEELERVLAAREVIARRVRNSHAFHSSLMQPIAAAFEAHARRVRLSIPRIPYTSNVTGGWATPEDVTDARYWVKHLTCTARFNDALRHLWNLNNPILVECGPGRTLAVLAAQHPDRQELPARKAVSPIRQRYENVPDQEVFLTAVGKIWLTGLPVLWDGMSDAQAGAGDAAAIPRDEAQQSTESSPSADLDGVDAARRASYEAPRNDLEISLTSACERVLGVPRVGITDNFFELGGHSLAVIKLVMEMKQSTGLDIDLGEIFRSPTIAQLVERLGKAAQRKAEIVVPLQPNGAEPPMFCICGIDLYREFAKNLAENQPVYGVYVAEEQAIIDNVLQGAATGVSIDRLVEAYYRAIVRFQPQGPYRFAGVSFGGLLAMALASRMRRHGAKVDTVFLFDTMLPEAFRRIWWKWLLARVISLASGRGRQELRRALTKLRRILFTRAATGHSTESSERLLVEDKASFYRQFIERQRTAFRAAYEQWNPEQSNLDFPVVLFRAALRDMCASDVRVAEDYGWRRYLGGALSIIDVPGGHVSMLAKPYVSELARHARGCLP